MILDRTPWAPGALAQLDELLTETIQPAQLLEESLGQRAAARAELAERNRRRDQARAEIETAQAAGLATLDVGTLTLLLDELDIAYDRYDHRRYPVEQGIRDAITTRQEQADPQPEMQAA